MISNPIYKPLGHLGGEQPYLGDLLTMVLSHLLNGMILQVSNNPFILTVDLNGFQWSFCAFHGGLVSPRDVSRLWDAGHRGKVCIKFKDLRP